MNSNESQRTETCYGLPVGFHLEVFSVQFLGLDETFCCSFDVSMTFLLASAAAFVFINTVLVLLWFIFTFYEFLL